MSEETVTQAQAAQAAQAAQVSTWQKGIQMGRHKMLNAIAPLVAANKLTEDDAAEIEWLYDYAQTLKLSYDELGERVGMSTSTVRAVINGEYAAASWAGPLRQIRAYHTIVEEEGKKKNIGFVETDTAKVIFTACRAAMNDGMPAFIYGASQIGKTTALLEFQRQHNHGRTRYLRLGSRWTKSRLVRELAVMLGNSVVRKHPLWALEDAILAGLNRRNLLIIDEFHLAIETATDEAAKAMVEFLREIYDRTGCGLVISSTKVGLTALEQGRNKLLFDQMARRGVVKVILPDVPKIRDINDFARAFDLPIPTGTLLGEVKQLLKTRGLGVFVKYLQKAYALSKERGQPLSWDFFSSVMAGYAALAAPKNDF